MKGSGQYVVLRFLIKCVFINAAVLFDKTDLDSKLIARKGLRIEICLLNASFSHISSNFCEVFKNFTFILLLLLLFVDSRGRCIALHDILLIFIYFNFTCLHVLLNFKYRTHCLNAIEI
jgi:hypothetical protein